MRAVRMTTQGLVLDPSAPEPAPGPGDAVIRTRRAGVFRAVAPVPPGATPGREFVGVIDSLHESMDAAERRGLLGQRVVGLAEVACTRCDLCRAGLSTHCRERRILGSDGMSGCLADRFVLPVRNLVPVPDALGDDAAVFAAAVACAVHAAQMVRLEGGAFVTVVGDGVTALLCAQALGARTRAVRLLGEHAERLALCEKWGIQHRHQTEAGRRADQAAVVECTGTPAGFELAARLVRPRGMIVLAGGGNAPVDLGPIAEGEVVVVGARSGPLRDAVALLAQGSIDTVSLIGRRARLENAAAALRSDPGLGLVVEF